jgi:hypothetical protein
MLAKANKVAKSSQETPSPSESISESSEVMEIHLDWCTPFMIYHRTRACQRTRTNVNDYIIEQDIILY